MKPSKALLFVLLAPLACSLAVADSSLAKVHLTPKDEQAIRKTVENIRSAIVSENIEGLLRNISQSQGLACTDTQYTYSKARKFLQNRSSVFYKSLFDSKNFSKDCGAGYPSEYPAISEKEFYSTASQEISIEVFDRNWVKVTIRSPVKTHYERWMYLHREGDAWRAAGGSFVIGECTCGG